MTVQIINKSAAAPGSDTQIIFNSGGVFAASPKFTFGPPTGQLRDGISFYSDGSISTNNGAVDIYPDGSADFAHNGIIFNPDGSAIFSHGNFRFDAAGLFVFYNNDTVLGNGVASIVGYYNDTKTDANISPTLLFTPPVDGLYEVSVVQLVTSPGTSGTLTTTIAWNDEAGATTAVPAVALSVAANGRDSGSIVISATSGNAISFSTVLTNVGSTTYRIKIAVKRLA
jgi:hypothetical protein